MSIGDGACMVILHFACIEPTESNGVCVAVPQHVEAQGRFADTALVNINGCPIPGVRKQLAYAKAFDVKKLPAPFDQPDVAVFHECYRPAYLSIAKNLKKNGVPYVIVPHGELRVEAQQKKHFKKVVANILLFNDFIEHAAALQCLSENERDSTHFGKLKFCGTNGVAVPALKKERFRESGAVFIYIGRYEWRPKGLDLLLDAIKIKERFLRENDCRFLLYGPDINDRLAAVSAMVRERNIEDLVNLNHEIFGEDKKKALLDADVFIQTSRHEGMPMGILEAMSYGLPCLVTSGTSLGGAVTEADAGWEAETTAEDIAECLEKAVAERSRWIEKGNSGRAAVKEYFSWDVVAPATVKLYRGLLTQKAFS